MKRSNPNVAVTKDVDRYAVEDDALELDKKDLQFAVIIATSNLYGKTNYLDDITMIKPVA
jgi:hypothetical protein